MVIAEKDPDQLTQEASSPPRASSQISLVSLGLLLAASAWAYWPTLVDLADTWDREPDYSHGWLVLPLFVFFLYLRRDIYPAVIRPAWYGLLVIAASIALRFIGGWYYFSPMDGWSIVVWFAGVALCLGGRPLLRWSIAPILFLMFMVPLPFRVETMVSQPLQKIAAQLSAFILRCMNQAAFAEETTLIVGNKVLEVEQSCSGLRIFVGIFALACGYLIAFRRELWESVLLIVSAVPVALLANASRIVLTAILFQHLSEESAYKFSHDVAGWLMIPLAAAMLAGVQWYLNCLMRDVTHGELSDVLKRVQSPAEISSS